MPPTRRALDMQVAKSDKTVAGGTYIPTPDWALTCRDPLAIVGCCMGECRAFVGRKTRRALVESGRVICKTAYSF